MQKESESALQQRIFIYHWNTYPSERGLLFHVNNNAKSRKAGAMLKAIGVVAGVSDLLYIHRGRLYALEVKLPKGRQSSAQQAWQKAVEDAGCEYHILRSLDDFKEFKKELDE